MSSLSPCKGAVVHVNTLRRLVRRFGEAVEGQISLVRSLLAVRPLQRPYGVFIELMTPFETNPAFTRSHP